MLQAMAYAKVTKSSMFPEIQLIMLPGPFRSSSSLPLGSGLSIAVILIRPESRGTLKIKGNCMKDKPLVDPNYLSEKNDVAKIIKGIRLSRDLFRQPPLASMIKCEYSPGDHVQSDEDIHDALRKNVASSYHYTGTCKMGKDSRAVINAELKVHGISRLRVADASIMPVIPPANINCACIMIGEKAADMILKNS